MLSFDGGVICSAAFLGKTARRAIALAALALVGAAPAQDVVGSLAGAPTPGFADAQGTAARFQFGNPSSVTVDASGNLFVADAGNHVIRKITPDGTVSTYAGAAGSIGATDGAALTARFNTPRGIAIDTSGNLFIADSGNHTIRLITPAGVVSTVAGSAGVSGIIDGAGGGARFNTPRGIATANGDVFIADSLNHTIRRLRVATGVVDTIAGTAGVTGNANGSGDAARFNTPSALTVNASGGTVWVADTQNHLIRTVTPGATAAATTVTSLAGAGVAGSANGTGSGASFSSPAGIVYNGFATLYVADTANHTLRAVSLGGAVTTYAGSPGAAGTLDGALVNARFNTPTGLAFTPLNNRIYVVDTLNTEVRYATSGPSIQTAPANATANSGGSATFSVAATGVAPLSYQWQSQPPGASGFSNVPTSAEFSGAASAQLAINPVAMGMNGTRFRVVVTGGDGLVATSASGALTVQQAPVFTSIGSANFTVGQAGSFQVVATGSPAPTFGGTGSFPSWASLNASTGLIAGTPPDTTGSPFTFTLTASNLVGTANQTFTLTVLVGPTISSQPNFQATAVGQTVQFTVTASSNLGPVSYQWQRKAAGVPGYFAILDNGHYSGTNTSALTISQVTGAENGDQFRVVVTGANGAAVISNPATLTVAQSPQFTSANSATFVEGQTNSFTVAATGVPAPFFSVLSGTLPAGLLFNGATGVISGTPAAGSSSAPPVVLQISAANGIPPNAVQTFTLTISATALAPSFTLQPAAATIAPGQPVTFTVAVSGAPTPTIQWQRQAANATSFAALTNDATFSGVTTTTLTISGQATGLNGDQYRAVATNSLGSTVSNAALLSVIVGTSLNTYAGLAGATGFVDATGSAARFNTPAAIAVDPLGNVYVADTSNHVIRRIGSGGVVTTLAGQAGVPGNTDGAGNAARFNAPAGIAVNSAGTVFVADTFNHTIRMVTPQGVVTTLAGVPGVNGSADGGRDATTGLSIARFNYPAGVAIDLSGIVYVSDTGNNTIRRVQPDGTVSTFAGLAGQRGTVNGLGTAARFASPNGLAVDSSGNVFVADSFNHAIRKITAAGLVSTYAGTIGTPGATDLPVLFNQPMGVAVDGSGIVYVADTLNNTLRRIAAVGSVTTIAGFAGAAGAVDGIGTAARLNQPFGVAVDTFGNIYVADTRSHTIRRTGIASAPQIQTQPANAVTPARGTATFTVGATGSPLPSIFQWQRRGANATDFSNLSDDATFSGSNQSTLTITGVTSAMQGDQYRVIVGNFISPDAVSNPATLTLGVAPAFTSAATATAQATKPFSFTVAATGTPAPSLFAAGLPPWATIDIGTGIISGTPPDTTGAPFTVTLTARNGVTTTQTLTINVDPAATPPRITTPPAAVTVDPGQTATFTVTVGGTPPFTYQWRRAGAPLPGATNATLTIPNAQLANADTYTVTVSNDLGQVTSAGAVLSINSAPTFVAQPQMQTALVGGGATLSAGALGSNLSYQWRKNGAGIPGATGATLTLSNLAFADAADYDVVVTNSLGAVTSSLAQLLVVATPTAPLISTQPAARAVLVGAPVTLRVAASGVPAPTFQWRRNGANLSGATSPTLTLVSAASADAGNYDVVIANSAGTVTSAPAGLRIITRSYAGIYFGAYSGSPGGFALYVREDNTAVFLGFLPAATAPVMNLELTISDGGQFAFTQAAISSASLAIAADEPGRAAAIAPVSVTGTIGADGSISGNLQGGANEALIGSKAAAGDTQGVAGFYRAGFPSGAAAVYMIVGPNGRAFSVALAGPSSDGGSGTVSAANLVNITTPRGVISATITPSTQTIAVTTSGGVAGSFTGANDVVLARQRLVNISSRARVATGESVAIAGFVIAGEESKPLLIRAVGPTLSLPSLNVSGALASPRLELFRGSTSIAVNTGIAGNRAVIDSASAQAGAFALGTSGADAAMVTTLAPGNYTAVISSTTGTPGVALIEVYDLSAPSPGQKLLNIATRATAGTADNTLIAGFVVPPGANKRVLVRAVGPGLANFGVAGVIARPLLILLNGNVTVGQNSNWTTSADAAAITAASAQVGAFPLANNDSAVIGTLPPGNYTAQVLGAGGTSGIALIEVYELP